MEKPVDRNSRLCSYKNGKPDLIFPLNETVFTIGRADDNKIQLLSDGVSRHHARLTASAVGWEIRDMDSTNGVLVNGVKTKMARLKDGDRIQLGDITLNLELRVEGGKWIPRYEFAMSSSSAHKTIVQKKKEPSR